MPADQPQHPPIDRGVSEFGALLADYLMAVGDCVGAVLTDNEGYPIDYARQVRAISTLDIQLIGAQIERPIDALRQRCADPNPIRVTMSTERGILVAAALGREYTLVALHLPEPDLGGLATIEEDFEALIARVRRLLFAGLPA